MSKLICEITGSRGRSIAVYDNKCVITTDVTLGSILTQNALDGRKTIFYIDVKGIQFKKSGLTLGYLQLETSSIQMNNQSSNMFSENTFTFSESSVGNLDALMEKVHDYIVDRIESYKYGTPAREEFLCDLILYGESNSSCRLEKTVQTQMEAKLREQEQAEKLRKEQEQAEKLRKEQASRQQMLEQLRRTTEGPNSQPQTVLFLKKAATCSRAVEVQNLWRSLPWDDGRDLSRVEQKINEAAQVERAYGSSPKSFQRLLEDLTAILSDA